MRAFVVFAILGVALGRDLCRNVKESEIRKVFSTARLGASLILGDSCPSFDIDRVVFENEECRDLVRQATCYSINAAELYNVEVVNYARLRSDVPNMESLGNLACEKTRACFREVRTAMEVCLRDNVEFVSETIEAAEEVYRENLEETVATFAKKNKGSLFGDLVNMAMQQFSSAEDIQTFIEGQLTEGMESDAIAAGEEALTLAQGWCDSGCTSKTAQFLRGLFRKMHGGQCMDASVFCGACATRADKFFEKTALPCCVEEVVQKGIEAYDYVVENYEDTLVRYADAIRAGLSQESIDEAIEIKDRLVEEFDCVSDVYLDNRPVCV